MSDWARVKLMDIVDRVTEKNVQGHDRVMTVAAGRGLVEQETYFNKRVASKDLSTYYVVREGDFVYNKSTSAAAAYGVVARYSGDAPGVVTPLYFAFRLVTDRVLSDYLLLVANGEEFFQSLAGMLREGSRAHGLLNVRLADFYGATVALPSLAEQRRIVDVTAAVDAQIEALRGEVDRNGRAYRALLAGLSETVERRPIESVVVAAFAGGTPARDQPDYYGGDIPWLKSGEVEGDDIQTTAESITAAGLLASSAKLVPVGATIVAMYGQGDTKGRAGFVGAPITTNQAVLALVPNESVVTPRFLLHSIRSQTVALRARAIGAAQPNLSKGLVVRHAIPVYGSLVEQETFSGAADLLRSCGTALLRELTDLRAFRSTLLASLLSQDVDIPKSYDAVLVKLEVVS